GAQCVLETARLSGGRVRRPVLLWQSPAPFRLGRRTRFPVGRRAASTGFAIVSAQNSVVVQIARPYASALFDLATESKSLPAIEKSLDELSALIGENAEFAAFLRSPAISSDDKARAFDAIVQKAE